MTRLEYFVNPPRFGKKTINAHGSAGQALDFDQNVHMCGRFALTLTPDAIAPIFAATVASDLMPLPRYNICPTQKITTVVSSQNGREFVPMRWGFLPDWTKDARDGPLLINARAETIAEKPAFRAACRKRRCLIPASGYYEWRKEADGGRYAFYIHRLNAKILAFAGIWQAWTSPKGETLTTCAIVTTKASETLAVVHPRMPVLISSDAYGLWLGERGKGAAGLMVSAPKEALVFHRVSGRVNSNRPDDPDLIEPVTAQNQEAEI